MLKKTLLFAMLTCAFGVQAQTVYKSEKNGVTVFSNSPSRGATKMELPPISVVPGRRSNESSSPSSEASSSAPVKHHGMPDQSDAQRSRESKRVAVLQEELGREQEELAKAEKALQEQESIRNGDEKNYQKALDRIQPYKDVVALHKKNIESIKKELAASR